MMKRTMLESQLESILFFAGDVVAIDRLCNVCEVAEIEVHKAVMQLNEGYEKMNSGLNILEIQTGYQMCTIPQNINVIQRYKQKPPKKLLTQALLETLAVIAYAQPITKVQIEDIRGVRAEHTLAKLTEYNLIEEVGRMNVVGKPILFGTTSEFLRHFGFSSVADIPTVKEAVLEVFKKEVQQEINFVDEIKEV
ncbi:MAG: SMC-Scp complex subunit ScpB [Epulopiscium sp. Nele67-Bin005]|nr:MAG: SMC-Scp complex subunit ScpB [Epulopiscium sp. Nele67-Bin005]